MGAFVINLHKYKSLGTNCIDMYANGNNRRASYDVIYFDNFGLNIFQKKLNNLWKTKIL